MGTIYWTARQLHADSWQFEDGWDSAAKAERAAKFYQREHKRRCVVVPVSEGKDKTDELRKVLVKHA